MGHGCHKYGEEDTRGSPNVKKCTRNVSLSLPRLRRPYIHPHRAHVLLHLAPGAAPEFVGVSLRYSAYSYGGGGGSSSDREDSSSNATNGSRTGTTSAVRESIQLLASSFVDLYPVGHAEASAKILGDGVNILLDLQGHTLGGRSEIAAARPAPIQVNFAGVAGDMNAIRTAAIYIFEKCLYGTVKETCHTHRKCC